MIIHVRSHYGLERIAIPDNGTATVATLRSLIESQLGVPAVAQTLSLDANLLLSNPSAAVATPAATLSNPFAPLSSLGLSHGSVVFLSYSGVAHSSSPPPPPLTLADSFGCKMTMDDLITCQIRISRPESPHCFTAYFACDATDAF